MTNDPAGYYAVLGVDRAATREAIVAAYRRKARVLHPDVPGTGNAAAFIRVKQAYEVLHDAHRRAAYDRSVVEPRFAPLPSALAPRPPRKAGAVWPALGGLACLAVVLVVLLFNGPDLPPAPLPAPVDPAPAPQLPMASVADGPTTDFVLPRGDETLLWRYDSARNTYLPAGRLADFTPVLALRLMAHGMVEIALADGGAGFVYPDQLTPGDRVAARRAKCAYNAGAPPANGELLAQRQTGPRRLDISNRGVLPVVVKLRSTTGEAAATVFVSPGRSTTLDSLPDADYRPEFAVGELWSRACNSFAAGMRAQRFSSFASLDRLSPLVVPPELSDAPAAVDISDETFERE